MFAAAVLFALAVLVALAASAAPASADEPKREKPNYAGREDPPPTAGDVLLWVPRILFFPPYVVAEYVLRAPLGALITTAERKKWPQILINFFTFGKDMKSGIVPTAFFDFGFRPSVGFYFWADDAFAKHNDVRIHASTWGSDWLAVAVVDRVHVSKYSSVDLSASWIRRPDRVFYGLGSRTLESDRSRYQSDILDVGLGYDLQLVRGIDFTSRVAFKKVDFRDSACCGDPGIIQRQEAGLYVLPPAYTEGYEGAYERAELALDSRPKRPSPQTGIRLAGMAEHGTDFRESRSWIKYGGTLGASWDMTGYDRVLSLTVGAEFADPVHGRGGSIPFTEQVVWGGSGLLRGFLPGRLVGRSAAAVMLQYEWPIWVWLNGAMNVATGNVFESGLKDFDPKLLRLSMGIGIRTTATTRKTDHRFELLVGCGSETFDQGGKIDSFRLVFGGTHGF